VSSIHQYWSNVLGGAAIASATAAEQMSGGAAIGSASTTKFAVTRRRLGVASAEPAASIEAALYRQNS
jgi:hypothetical protein